MRSEPAITASPATGPAGSPPADPPPIAGLDVAVRQCYDYLERAARARGAEWVNAEGGDVGVHGSHRSVVRHVANYLAAAELAEHVGLTGPVLDVGSGVGALAAWMADRLSAPLHLVDHDARIRRVAEAAFDSADVHASLDAAPQASLVTAMEVVEHIARPDQPGFVAALVAKIAPGGLLVMSTPDEARYAGGWSGYAPHIGVLSASALADLLAGAGVQAIVWRIEGEPYALGSLRRVAEPLANRSWTALTRLAPGLAARLGGGATSVAAQRDWRTAPVPSDVCAVPPAVGRGTGLLAVAARAAAS